MIQNAKCAKVSERERESVNEREIDRKKGKERERDRVEAKEAGEESGSKR